MWGVGCNCMKWRGAPCDDPGEIWDRHTTHLEGRRGGQGLRYQEVFPVLPVSPLSLGIGVIIGKVFWGEPMCFFVVIPKGPFLHVNTKNSFQIQNPSQWPL